MTITIELSTDHEEQLKQRAARAGVNPAEYARRLVEQGLCPSPSITEILAPFRKQVEETGAGSRNPDLQRT